MVAIACTCCFKKEVKFNVTIPFSQTFSISGEARREVVDIYANDLYDRQFNYTNCYFTYLSFYKKVISFSYDFKEIIVVDDFDRSFVYDSSEFSYEYEFIPKEETVYQDWYYPNFGEHYQYLEEKFSGNGYSVSASYEELSAELGFYSVLGKRTVTKDDILSGYPFFADDYSDYYLYIDHFGVTTQNMKMKITHIPSGEVFENILSFSYEEMNGDRSLSYTIKKQVSEDIFFKPLDN